MTALASQDDSVMHADEIRAAFEDVFDQAVMFHGYADYMRDYDVYLHTTADPRTGIVPQHVRYRFTHCVRAVVTSTIPASVWSNSLDERLTDYEQGCDLDGYVWGVCWHALYPGMTLVSDSPTAEQWSTDLGIPFHEATIETNAHHISLVFSGLVIDVLEPGHAPFVVVGSGPEFKHPIR